MFKYIRRHFFHSKNGGEEKKNLNPSKRPELITINHDNYHAKHVGYTNDGRQFFLTTPFEPASNNNEGAEYVALFIFDREGNLIEDEIECFGPRKSVDPERICECYEGKLESLGAVIFGRIEVKPFKIERFETEFGLIIREPEEDGDVLAVELQPGNYMAFFEPWDSGEYDT